MARPWRLFWLIVLGFHGVAASAWWWLMPGGFPPGHPRFWLNGVAPVLVLALVVSAVRSARRQRWDRLRAALAAFPAAWVAAAVSGRVAFPVTLAWLFVVPMLAGAGMGAALVLTFRQVAPAWGRSVGLVAAIAVAFGLAVPLAFRPPAPDTRPLNVPMPGPLAGAVTPSGRVGPRVFVHAGDGSLSIKAGGLNLAVQPLLRFLSRSPDGCLTILAPRAFREGPEPRLTAAALGDSGFDLRYRADGEASLRVGPDDGRGPIVVEALTRLPRPVDSHLNGFCDIEVTGHRRLSLSFSPCPDRPVEVRPTDYPVGRPLRLAYLDAAGGFHVVEATSGEKGPFRELAGGPLSRSEPLAITLHDRGTAVARVTLHDWAAQAGTALSPTAGWGVPVNAIEFSLQEDAPGSSAALYISLASTSVGRGWDSVGHSAGTYRNRLTVEALSDPPSPGAVPTGGIPPRHSDPEPAAISPRPSLAPTY